MMGAIAFQKGLGVTHSCAHALGTVADMHHGLANGIMINYALKMNVAAVPERFERMAMTVGLKDHSGAAFIKWLEGLKAECGIPKKLSDAKVDRSQKEKLVKVAVEDACHPNNPVTVTKADFEKIFDEAF